MESETLSRAALGRIASIGDFYDARSDNFCSGISIFKQNIPTSALTVTTVDAHSSDIHFAHKDDFSEKSAKLDVETELQVSVLASLFPLEGSGKYLSDQVKSARNVKSSLIHNILTVEENVDIYHEDLKHAFDIDAIENGRATHVVTGISWGANSILSCIYENRENHDVKEIEKELLSQMKKIASTISGKGTVEIGADGDNVFSFDVRIHGDVLPTNQRITTVEEALTWMKQLSTLVANNNGGKGKPLTYRLLPIAMLKNYLKLQIGGDITLQTLEEDRLTLVVKLFDEVATAQQQLNELHQDALEFQFCVPPEDISKISSLKDMMAIQEAALRSNLSSMLPAVRSGTSDVSQLEDLIRDFESSDIAPQNVSAAFTTTWGSLIEKIDFARTMVQNEVKYVGLNTTLDAELITDFDRKAMIIFFTAKSRTDDPERWKWICKIFLQERKKINEDYNFFAVDCDIHPEMMPKSKSSCIQVFQSGRVIKEDMLAEYQRMMSIPWAKATTNAERLLHTPKQRCPLSIPCTGKSCSSDMVYTWNCVKCKEILEYGFDSHVYCKCGKTPVNSLEFKCPDSGHVLNFEQHEGNYLNQFLEELRPFKDLNILILGETGVGKSTWINGFVNFLTYQSMEEAEIGELCTLIPSEFTVYSKGTKGLQRIVVRTGEDENEVFKKGQSATQECKVYPFRVGNKNIRLIDTPGIGDTRGIEQDQKNFQNILGTLSYLQEIHGICILLKPNNARLTVMFRFCIKELLKYLHRDASKNILFCFTNSRSTMYAPGDTMNSLESLLSENKEVEIGLNENTVYCFDSEAYRFLAAVKNDPPVNFEEKSKATFAESWEYSRVETNRMLDHICSLKPHPIQSTMNLNHARELVLKLTRPLAEINRNIQTNKANLVQEKNEIEQTDANIEKLMRKQWTTRTEIETRALSYPKTVCSNSNCVKVWTLGNISTTEYITVCHEHCDLKGVQRDSVGDPGLMGCLALYQTGGERCHIATCGHRYNEHLHIYYDSVQVPKNVKDQAVIEAMAKGMDAKQMKQAMIEKRNEDILKYESEQKEIERASVKFAVFLKRNAITPYNDAMEDYLNHLIREENEKVKHNGNPKPLEYLRDSLASYLEEKKILETAMSKGESGSIVLNPDEVDQLVENLKGLQFSGVSLKEALECVDLARKVVYQEIVLKDPSHYMKGPCRRQDVGMFSRAKRFWKKSMSGFLYSWGQ